MVVRMRSNRSHTGNRRSHHAMEAPRLSACPSCGKLGLRHRVCTACGKYRGRAVVDMAAVAEKQAKRQKAKEKEVAAK